MPGASGRVLVVDDNKVIRQLIRVNLELEGIEVVTASDGAECLDVVHQVQPDLVTLDVVMPRLDGLRTAARLRADPRTRDLPVAIISACTQYEVEVGLESGVDGFLAKPFEPDALVDLVRRLLEQAKQDKEKGEGQSDHGRQGEQGEHGDQGEGSRCGGVAGHAASSSAEASVPSGSGLSESAPPAAGARSGAATPPPPGHSGAPSPSHPQRAHTPHPRAARVSDA